MLCFLFRTGLKQHSYKLSPSPVSIFFWSSVICAVLMASTSFSPRRRTPSASKIKPVGGAGVDAGGAEFDGVDFDGVDVGELVDGVGAGVDAELVDGTARTRCFGQGGQQGLDGVGAAVDAELVDGVGAVVDAELVVDGSFRFCNFAKLNGIGFGEISGQ